MFFLSWYHVIIQLSEGQSRDGFALAINGLLYRMNLRNRMQSIEYSEKRVFVDWISKSVSRSNVLSFLASLYLPFFESPSSNASDSLIVSVVKYGLKRAWTTTNKQSRKREGSCMGAHWKLNITVARNKLVYSPYLQKSTGKRFHRLSGEYLKILNQKGYR